MGFLRAVVGRFEFPQSAKSRPYDHSGLFQKPKLEQR
jgi:hypothetical protein